MRKIVKHLQSVQVHQEETEIFCTYCIHSPVPADKSCLMCEASLCDNHLRVHSKSPEHVLTEPTTSMEKRKCSVHKKILEYYCLSDSACICVSCRLEGEHRGHEAEMLQETFKKKRENLKNDLQKLKTRSEETERKVQGLQECKRKVKERADGVLQKVTVMFNDTRRQLENLEEKVQNVISRQKEQILLPASDLIQQLEIKKYQQSWKVDEVEKLCTMTDPQSFLQKMNTSGLCDTEEGGNEDGERFDQLPYIGGDMDVTEISNTLHTGFSGIIKEVKTSFNIQKHADILLDVNTAHHKLNLSEDRKMASWSDVKQNLSESSRRFKLYYQVLGIQRFSSGRCYWDIDVSESRNWVVGMSYSSIDRRGHHSAIGCNNKSWGLGRYQECFVIHAQEKISLPGNISCNLVRVSLDYEAGQLSFYNLCGQIRHLHTFTATFTEPLHAALCVSDGSIKICEMCEKKLIL
uniref:Uncharacterized protein n=2 Tax=Pyxicephalus adspersus TaxID=30357 RepID=A0AAV3AME9_PYXAD|nr:TPA: hypothetical protein GDO54_011658 [Pyxicephalus adspersus]